MEHAAKEGRESDPIRPLRCISPKPESPAHYEWKCRLVQNCEIRVYQGLSGLSEKFSDKVTQRELDTGTRCLIRQNQTDSTRAEGPLEGAEGLNLTEIRCV